MNQAITMHGWCSDSTYWRSWETSFRLNGWTWKNNERGYGYMKPSEPLWENIPNTNTRQQKVVFCHSLGLHLISNELIKQASEIILLNSFSRFIPLGNEKRAVEIALKGMRKHIGMPTEEKMIKNFLYKAKHPLTENTSFKESFVNHISSKGRHKLKLDLEVLINTDRLPCGLHKKSKVLIINGGKDKIISKSTREFLIDDLTNHLDQAPDCWTIDDQGHFISLSHLTTKITKWLKKGL